MVRITEIFANPTGTDRGHEWVELCADSAGGSLAGATLAVGRRSLPLSGILAPGQCALVETGTAAIRNQFADVSLQAAGTTHAVRTAGSAPEGAGFHVPLAGEGFWASSTPGAAEGSPPTLPPPPDLPGGTGTLPLLGTAACTAGILTALALAALRHARDRHHALRE